jgi:hypothetical protein
MLESSTHTTTTTLLFLAFLSPFHLYHPFYPHGSSLSLHQKSSHVFGDVQRKQQHTTLQEHKQSCVFYAAVVLFLSSPLFFLFLLLFLVSPLL